MAQTTISLTDGTEWEFKGVDFVISEHSCTSSRSGEKMQVVSILIKKEDTSIAITCTTDEFRRFCRSLPMAYFSN